MHTVTRNKLQGLAENLIDENGGDMDEAHHDYIAEARNQYEAAEDGDPESYLKEANDIFDAAQKDLAGDFGTDKLYKGP